MDFFIFLAEPVPQLQSFDGNNKSDIDSRQRCVDEVRIIFGFQITNRLVLWVSAISFGLFVLAEIIGALASNSLSLLGDACAMSVDVFTVSIVQYIVFNARS